MSRIWRITVLFVAAGVALAACDTEEKPKDKAPLEVKQEEAKDSTRLDPAPDTSR